MSRWYALIHAGIPKKPNEILAQLHDLKTVNP